MRSNDMKKARAKVVKAYEPKKPFNPTLPPEFSKCQNGGGHTGYIMVTPKMARELLERNTLNRQVSRRWVATLAEYIRKGRWQATGEPIIVSKSGRLLDGQHRLLAIMEADKQASMMLIRDIDDSAIQWIDNGMPRNAFSRAKLAGLLPEGTNRKEVDVAVYLLRIEYDNSRPDQLDISEALQDVKFEANYVCGLMNTPRRNVTITPVRAALAGFMKKYDVGETEMAKIIQILYDGMNFDSLYKPIVIMRNVLLQIPGVLCGDTGRSTIYRKMQRGLLAFQNAECPSRLMDSQDQKPLWTVLPPLPEEE